MDYIIGLLQNLLSNPIYENSELLKSSIEKRITSINSQIQEIQTQIEKQNDLLNLYKSNLETAEKKYEESKDKLKQYNNLCNILKNNFTTKDSSRIYERIVKIIKEIFNNYTNNRNKLYNEIILKIFEFKKTTIKLNDKTKIKNNITKIKDNITYKEVIKLTCNAKIIIYDLKVSFNTHRNTHTTTYTKSCSSFFHISFNHFMNKRNKYSSS